MPVEDLGHELLGFVEGLDGSVQGNGDGGQTTQQHKHQISYTDLPFSAVL